MTIERRIERMEQRIGSPTIADVDRLADELSAMSDAELKATWDRFAAADPEYAAAVRKMTDSELAAEKSRLTALLGSR